ncbi:MAG: TetR/AcrR family transcriptional regulator [Proteobacteria bacterium]|nr:TetR/AcrR family transcriptional regulator [Pseudomonadota bacterium]
MNEESSLADLSEPAPTTPRLSQAERTARTERRLLSAALHLIAERGYERTTLAAIGAEAGVSRGLVSHCFGSKAGLLGALVEQMLRRWGHDSLRPAVGDRVGIEALHAAIDAVVLQSHRAPRELRAFYALLFEALGPIPELGPRFAELHGRLRHSVAEWIEAGVAAGQVRADVDAQAQAALFLGAFRGAMYQWLLDPEAIDLDRLFAEHKRSVQRALRPE